MGSTWSVIQLLHRAGRTVRHGGILKHAGVECPVLLESVCTDLPLLLRRKVAGAHSGLLMLLVLLRRKVAGVRSGLLMLLVLLRRKVAGVRSGLLVLLVLVGRRGGSERSGMTARLGVN